MNPMTLWTGWIDRWVEATNVVIAAQQQALTNVLKPLALMTAPSSLRAQATSSTPVTVALVPARRAMAISEPAPWRTSPKSDQEQKTAPAVVRSEPRKPKKRAKSAAKAEAAPAIGPKTRSRKSPAVAAEAAAQAENAASPAPARNKATKPGASNITSKAAAKAKPTAGPRKEAPPDRQRKVANGKPPVSGKPPVATAEVAAAELPVAPPAESTPASAPQTEARSS